MAQKQRRRPHSSDTNPEDSDFNPGSDISENLSNQLMELERCNRSIGVIDEGNETERIVNEQARLFGMHMNQNVSAVAHNTSPERDGNSNVSSDVVPESGVDILDNLENFNDGLMDFEELIDYDYDEISYRGNNR